MPTAVKSVRYQSPAKIVVVEINGDRREREQDYAHTRTNERGPEP